MGLKSLLRHSRDNICVALSILEVVEEVDSVCHVVAFLEGEELGVGLSDDFLRSVVR